MKTEQEIIKEQKELIKELQEKNKRQSIDLQRSKVENHTLKERLQGKKNKILKEKEIKYYDTEFKENLKIFGLSILMGVVASAIVVGLIIYFSDMKVSNYEKQDILNKLEIFGVISLVTTGIALAYNADNVIKSILMFMIEFPLNIAGAFGFLGLIGMFLLYELFIVPAIALLIIHILFYPFLLLYYFIKAKKQNKEIENN